MLKTLAKLVLTVLYSTGAVYVDAYVLDNPEFLWNFYTKSGDI